MARAACIVLVLFALIFGAYFAPLSNRVPPVLFHIDLDITPNLKPNLDIHMMKFSWSPPNLKYEP